ncbi:MAG TPA: zf-HC2 domain-containing protein [Solirubrobacteraceae bacterium]|jgi:Putative zinc-finger|nr:zf-HC2 domain-containing protein [Solirubrobacteraceae bacterium]
MSTACEHVRPDLGAYALGALEPAEAAAVEAHLPGCPDCAAELARLEPLPGLVARADGLEIPPPPAALEERILDRVATSRPRDARRPHRFRRPRRFGVLAATALAGIAVGIGATVLATSVTGGGGEGGGAPAYDLVLDGADGVSARADFEPNDGGTEVHLWVDGLPPGGKAVYEVLCERPGWSAGAGTFRADAQGKAYVVLTTAARIGEYERIRIVRGEDDVLTGSIN